MATGIIPELDDHDAIALAVCHDPDSFGEKGSDPIPICLRHALERGRFWKLLPLPFQSADEAHQMVRDDSRYFQLIPDVIGTTIKKKWNDLRERSDIFKKVGKYSNYWGFNHNGIFYGIESDGHIHT